jgi:hypothetical protein
MAERTLTVQEASNRYGVRPGSDRSHPAILLKDRWLNDVGFLSRSHGSVQVERNRFVITLLEGL